MFLQLPKNPEEFFANGGLANWQETFANIKQWSKIPLLNYTPLHLLKDGVVVRFRGMVQDMRDPEIYLERYEVKTVDGNNRLLEGKYMDCLQLKNSEEVMYNSKKNKYGERRTLFVVSIPALNDWTKEYEQNSHQNSMQVDNQKPEDGMECSSNEVSKKRSMVIDEEMDIGSEISASSQAATTTDTHKRQRTMEQQDPTSRSSASLSSTYLLNSPIPDRPSMACMIKLYEDFDAYTLNSFVDIIGFLSIDPSLDASTINEAMCEDIEINEFKAQNPPPSLIPRLHAIMVKKLQHANPLLDESFLSVGPVCESINMESVNKDLRMLLTLCLFNDANAAEYLLSHLISTVYSRSEMQSIGKFALNICNLPKDCLPLYTEKFYEIIELLLPTSHYLPLTLDIMNDATFTPKKDYVTDKLVSGLLQLGPHTHIVLDETRLQQGKLEASGVLAVQHLSNLINNQQIKCDFLYYNMNYDVNVPVLVLSEGRSMLPSDIILPLQTDAEGVGLIEETLKAANHYLQPERLDQFRRYLTLACISDFMVTDEQTEKIQNDFVQMRKENAKVNAEDLHALLVLSRLLAIARGKSELDNESWQLAKELEENRRRRIEALPKSNTHHQN